MSTMTVNYAGRPIEQRESYCTSMLVGQYAICYAQPALVLLAVGCLYQAGVLDLDTTRLATVLGIAAVGGMLWEFSRRYYYLRLQPGNRVAMGYLLRIDDGHWACHCNVL